MVKGTNELGHESVLKLLMKFSIPSIIGMLVNALYSIVDRFFVGRGVGSLALSGVAVTFPISNVIMAFGMLVGVGSGAIVSIKLGQNKHKEAEKIIGNALTLVVIFSVLITLVGIIFLEPILNLFGASAETMPDAKQFAFIILLGVVLQNIGFGMNPIIRSEGDPKTAMKTMLIGAVLNFIINPLFIFVFKLGVRGSALATICSQAVCSVWILYYFVKGKSLLKVKKENLKLSKVCVKEIISIGMSPFAMQLAASLITITFNRSLSKYGGDIAIGAFSLINSVSMLILMPVFGINQGAQPIIGYNYGAKNIDRVKLTLKYASIAATLICVLGFIIVQLFPAEIISIFNESDESLVDIGARGISIFLSMLPIVGFQAICTNYFQAVGKAKISMFLSLLRQVIVLLPLIIILPKFFNLDGVWVSGPTSDFISVIITTIFIIHEMKSLSKLKKQYSEEYAC
jgi:putative MATE family efflux protein